MKRARPIRVEGDIAYIPLTKGYEAIIDAADVPLVNGCNWQAHEKKRGDGSIYTVYAVRFFEGDGKRTSKRLHRVLLGDGALHVDHIDGDGLNNRRCNLRAATRSQNMHNQRVRRDNASGFKGVHLDKRTSMWTAQIASGGKRKRLGSYGSPEEAHAAYVLASARLHGEFGRVA
jgi:AP2 domain/HNH endonuclease